MKADKKTRAVLDAILTAMIIAAMLIEFTGVFLHEVIGFAFFAALVTHLVFSARWITSTVGAIGQRKASGRRKALAAVGILLAIAMSALAVSSIAISTILSSAGFTWPFGDYGTWTAVHAVSSYSLCAIVVVHLAMHWAFVANVLKISYRADRRKIIAGSVYTGAAIGAGALGFAAIGEALPPVVQPETVVAESVQATAQTESADESAQTPAQQSPQATTSQANTRKKSKKDGAKAFRSQQKPSQNAQPDAEPQATQPGATQPGASQPEAAQPETTQPETAQSETSQPQTSQPESASQAPTTPDQAMREYSSSQPSESASAGSDAESSTPLPTGFCTLCRKRCALSAPQCDRPYEAGLITTSQVG